MIMKLPSAQVYNYRFEVEPPSCPTRDSLLDSYLGKSPRQTAMTGLFLERTASGGNPQDRARPLNHGRTDRSI